MALAATRFGKGRSLPSHSSGPRGLLLQASLTPFLALAVAPRIPLSLSFLLFAFLGRNAEGPAGASHEAGRILCLENTASTPARRRTTPAFVRPLAQDGDIGSTTHSRLSTAPHASTEGLGHVLAGLCGDPPGRRSSPASAE